MYSNHRDQYREAFFSSWQKHKAGLPKSRVEQQIIDVIIIHPEYHTYLENPKQYLHQAFEVEENPFLHMSFHLALRDQIATNRPVGIVDIVAVLRQQQGDFADLHHIEHLMMMCLSQMLSMAQQGGVMPTDDEYLLALRQLIRV